MQSHCLSPAQDQLAKAWDLQACHLEGLAEDIEQLSRDEPLAGPAASGWLQQNNSKTEAETANLCSWQTCMAAAD